MFRLFFATFLLLVSPGLSFALDEPRALSSSFVREDDPWDVPDLIFKDGNGREHTLLRLMRSELRGRYVLLNVWATWCTPCLAEMPSLNKLQAVMAPRNLHVVALSVDREGAVLVPAYYRRNGFSNLKVYFDPSGTAMRRLGLRGIPTTLFIGPDGKEIGRVSKPVDWTRADNLAFLNDVVSAGQRQPLMQHGYR